ncbi:hypothetical protein ES707_19093 [subsurface metagenome]
MSNSFNISVKPEIAAVSAKIDTVDAVVDLIRGTDVPAIKTNIDANETKIIAIDAVVDLIRGTDVPAIQTNIDANETKIDALPSHIRGALTTAGISINSATYIDLISVTGSGRLYHIRVNTTGQDDVTFKFTIDSIVSNELVVPAEEFVYIHVLLGGTPTFGISYIADPPHLYVEYKTGLLVQAKTPTGSSPCTLLYAVD